MAQHRADYMSQHSFRCARRYWKRVQTHASLDGSDHTTELKSTSNFIQLDSSVSQGRDAPYRAGDNWTTSDNNDQTLRIVHENAFDARLTEHALTCALLFFEKMNDTEAYKKALAVAFRLNATIDSMGIRPREQHACFNALVHLALMIDQLGRGHVSIETTNGRNMTIMHVACAAGLAELLEPLFWRGASFDTLDDKAQTPLSWAVRSADVDTVLFALALGADPKLGCPFAIASLDDKRDIMTILLEYGADVNETFHGATALGWAIHEGNLDRVRFVLSLGAESDLLMFNLFPDCDHDAFDDCVHEQIFLALLEYGADIEQRDCCGDTLFHLAARKTYTRLLRALLDRVTSTETLDLTDEHGRTALYYAARKSEKSSTHRRLAFVSIVQMLIDAGADVNVQDAGGFSALIEAADLDHVETVRLLLDAGADTNLRNNSHATALSFAALSGHASIVQLLLDAGADIDARTATGDTPLSIARRWIKMEVVDLLLAAGARE
jgi:ankyrin repeat protein